MRVLIYSDHFFPLIGGSELFASDLANGLELNGNEVLVVTSVHSSIPNPFNFSLYRLKKTLNIKSVNLNFLEFPGLIKNFRPDICLINYQTGGENVLLFLLKMFRIPTLIIYHADHIMVPGKILDELQAISFFRLANKILVQTEREKKRFLTRGLPSSKVIRMNFNGVDRTIFKCNKIKKQIGPDSIKLICIARLDNVHKYKGVDKILEEFSKYKDLILGFNIELDIVGDGPLRVEFENICYNAHLNNVHFFGELGLEDLIDQICNSNFLLLPAIDKAEGFGRVALEAISCGIPVIVSKYAGISEKILEYDAGIVFDPNDIFDMLNEILAISKNGERYQTLLSNANFMIDTELFTLESITKEFENIQKNLINDINPKSINK